VLRVVIKTEVPKWCIIKNINRENVCILFKQVWPDKCGIRALVTFKTPNGNKSKILKEHRCPLAESILNSGAVILSAVVKDCEILWSIACTDDEFKRLMNSLDGVNVHYELIWKSKFFDENDDLSYRELEALMIAFNHGYFENPKKIKLEEIAEIIGVSKATASDLLRRAVKKVIKKYVSQL